MSSKPGITCSKCGAVVPVNRMYCDECGAEIEHDPNEVKASVDLENRIDRIKAISKTVRWFLAAAFVLTIVGHYFRKAYKQLPQNDVVAFATAPTVDISEEETADTLDFGVALPELKEAPKPPDAKSDKAIDNQLAADAFRRAVVSIKKKGVNQPIKALLVGDQMLPLTIAGQATPTRVHVADIRSIRPLTRGLWEIQAHGLKTPVRTSFAKPGKIHIQILEFRADDKQVHLAITLDQIQELKPL